MVQRWKWLDAVREQGIHESAVKVDARLIHAARAFWQHPRPTDAEAICTDAQLAHQANVFREPPVMIARDVASGPVGDFARRASETVPDVLAGPVGKRRALDLISARRRTPEEIRRKRVLH
jgi:hypothetical protein